MQSGPPGTVGRLKGALRDAVPELLRRRILGATRPLLFRGDVVQCPCCDGRFSRFMTHRGIPDVRCPRCGSLERHRLLWLYITRNGGLLADRHRVLHLAPEPCLMPLLRDQMGVDYTSADLDSTFADVHCNIQALPFADDAFDVVVCNHVLEHISDDRKALRELKRVLEPGGIAILMCPIARDRHMTVEDPAVQTHADRLGVYGQEDHVRLYGSDYVGRIEDAGFKVRVVRYLDDLDESLLTRHVLHRRHDLFEADDIYLGET